MAKLGKEHVMVACEMVDRGVSMRAVARQLGVSEGAIRYHRRQAEAERRVDGRSQQATSLDGYEPAVETILERLDCRRVTGRGRPVQARTVCEILRRDFGYDGSYRGVVRHLRRAYGVPPVRALRRVETPPGVQAQHDWFEIRTRVGGEAVVLPTLVGTLSHSRARFAWVSRETGQLAWHEGHLALFERYGGVPRWVRIDNLKTGVASGAGPTAVVNGSYRVFARECGFEIDPCRAATGSDKGKTERSVRTFRDNFGDLFGEDWTRIAGLQAALDERADGLLDRLMCPVTGTSVREALHAERLVLQPLPELEELFDVVVSRRVSRDCLVSFEGRRYSVPFPWVGRDVEILGTLGHVVIRSGALELARHPRKTARRLVIDFTHYEGASTDGVLQPTPLGHRARLQLAGLSGPSANGGLWLPAPERVRRPMDAYVELVEAFR